MALNTSHALAAFALAAGLTACATPATFDPGNNICAGQSLQIYFGQDEGTLSPVVGEAISQIVDAHATCPSRTVQLVSVSGNDTAGSPQERLQARGVLVQELLTSRGIPPGKIVVITSGAATKRIPPAPIARVVATTVP
jgi:outer membrane protein OmpA-like peptidoglycan-associated protein